MDHNKQFAGLRGMDEVPPAEVLSLGASLGQIIAAYRDKESKQCAEALVQVVRIVEWLENERDGLSYNKADLVRCLEEGVQLIEQMLGPTFIEKSHGLAAWLRSAKQKIEGG